MIFFNDRIELTVHPLIPDRYAGKNIWKCGVWSGRSYHYR